MIKKVIMLAVLITASLGICYANSEVKQVQKPKKAAIKEDQQKMIPLKAYPMKKKEYSRGTIATH